MKYFWAMSVAIAAISACALGPEVATLKGKVKIGPISPVQRVGVEEVVPVGWYRSYTMVAVAPDSFRIIARTKVTDTGTFEFRLPAGSYRIGYESKHEAIREKSHFVEVTLKAKEVKLLKIDIDTGIR